MTCCYAISLVKVIVYLSPYGAGRFSLVRFALGGE